ncbi:MAG: hypothetical protein IK151_09470 [Erysipelotrichaceae bacterium]|nr:hypothetical protein [Erysipelotrichaceae bacterium]
MARKRKVRADRVIILVLLAILVTGLLGFGFYKALDYFAFGNNNKPSDKPTVDPKPVETNDNVKVSLVDYQVFTGDSEEIGFDFIIAQLKFESDKPISFDLGNLQTSEKIYLNNVSKYINTLEEKSYKLTKLNIVNTVVSDQNVYTCNVFIPFTTDSYSLRLLNSVDATMIEFDLDNHINDVSTLKFDTAQQIEVGNTNVTVSSCSVSTMMLHNGMEYQVPSTMNVYTFNINVNKVEGNVMITDARFVRAVNDEVINCMDETYESVKVDNCLGKKLVAGENGALFFETTANSGNPDYSGYLMLMFSNSNDWVKIPTVLE